jgi:hypothetical protein
MGVGDRGGERKCSTVNPAFKGSGRAGGLDSYLHLPCALPFRQPGAALEAGFGAEALAALMRVPEALLSGNRQDSRIVSIGGSYLATQSPPAGPVHFSPLSRPDP